MNRLTFASCFLGAVLLVTSVVFPQTRASVSLTQCVRAALAHHPTLAASRKTEKEKISQARSLKAQTLPQLEYNLTAGAFRFSPYHYRTFENSLEITWNPGEWFGKLRELGLADAALAHFRTRQNQLELVFEVKQAFYRLVLARRENQIARISERSLQHHLHISQELFRLGQMDQLDLYRTQTKLAAAKEAVAAAENHRRQWRIRLTNLTGIPIAQSDSLVLPPQRKTDILRPDSLLSLARRTNPTVQILAQEIRKTQLQERLIHASRLPLFTLSGGFVFDNDPTAGGNYAVVRGGLRFPLVDWHQRKNQVQVFRLHRESLVETRKALLLDIRTHIEKLLTQLRYLKNLETLKAKTLSQAQKALFLTEKSYKAGVASNTDVLLAQKEWIHAKLSQEAVHLQFWLTQAELDFLIGKMGVLK